MPQSLDQELIRRLAIWTLVYLIPAYQAMLPVEDPDIWWHLRTGQWIFDHGSVPVEDPFSIFGVGKSWIAYSWLFEVLIYGIHSYAGLVGVVVFTVAMSLAIAVAIHLLLRRGRLAFPVEVSLLALILAALKPVLSPRPWLFSILLSTIVLIVILNVRRSGKLASGLALIPLFALWANLHIQFIYGLAMLGLLAVEAVVVRVAGSRIEPNYHVLPVGRAFALLGLCALAALANPYHYRVYFPIVEYAAQTGAFQNISELHPMFFRSLGDWIVLALTVTGAFALGWQRRWNIFHMALFGLAAYVAFRARRDVWFLMIAVAAIAGEFGGSLQSSDHFKFGKARVLSTAVALLVSLYGLSRYRDVSEMSLAKAVENHFPVKAVEFVKANGIRGQLYNSLDWGGYLIWTLPHLPVSMDGRTNLHGDERISRSLATWGGASGWEKDPELVRARLIIAQMTKPLTHIMRGHPRYRLVYEDSTAAVFIVIEAAS